MGCTSRDFVIDIDVMELIQCAPEATDLYGIRRYTAFGWRSGGAARQVDTSKVTGSYHVPATRIMKRTCVDMQVLFYLDECLFPLLFLWVRCETNSMAEEYRFRNIRINIYNGITVMGWGRRVIFVVFSQ